MRGDGERLLLKYSPVFKRRYAVDGGFVLGCTIGCIMCYYRFIDVTREFFGTGKIKELATAEEFCEFVENSKLIRKDRDILIIGAQNDASIQKKHVLEFLEIFPYRNKVLLLHRPPYTKKDAEMALSDERVYLGTTITPGGKRLGWTPVSEESQMKGLEMIVSLGVPPERIPVEIGPVNEKTYIDALEIIEFLAELGFADFVYRGVSVGSFNVDISKDVELLRQRNFLTNEIQSTPYYVDEGTAKKHEYYAVKNYLPEEIEAHILDKANELGMTPHRITATYYKEVMGTDIAYNRHNTVRFSDAKKVPASKVEKMLEWLGLPATSVEWRGDHFFVELEDGVRATEDIATMVGAELNTAVIFNRFTNSPDLDDVKLYWENDLFALKHLRFARELAEELGVS